MLIFEKSRPGCQARSQMPVKSAQITDLPQDMLRSTPPSLPEVSELEVVRHYTLLSQKNFCIDTNFYPLGSCTMKYNPRAAHRLASLPGFLDRHPCAHKSKSQGVMSCLYQLQKYLCALTGMQEISLAPMAGAQGELAGVAMIKRYHLKRQDYARTTILVPDAAHGTNPASAVMCGYRVQEIKTNSDGDVDLEDLTKHLGPDTAGIMLTNPSTLGVFETKIAQISKLVHDAGGLLYYDGANLNAIMGQTKPGDMGFDVMHLNLHKTFATPHGGGGPGAGPVAAGARLKEFLPIPMVGRDQDGYCWLTEQERPASIGRLSGFAGNAGILLRAYAYTLLLGRDGLKQAAQLATLNANYLMRELEKIGYTPAFPGRLATHEFIITLEQEAKDYGVTALDVSKALLEYGVHAPTMYFPLLVPECLLIEPTETECKRELDHFVAAMADIRQRMQSRPESLKRAPASLPSKRLDEVKAARELDIVWRND